jgi:2-methylisocitrate lyase-like PEP mutase family enzyme
VTAESRSAVLRRRLAQGPIVVAPGVADALMARVVEDSGFEVVYVTGSGIANTRLGMADLGLATLTEVVETVQRITDAVSIPVIADADNGHGGVLNVMRTVREFERAGAAAIHIEDQVIPKRCGHFDGKEVIPLAEMTGRLRAALDARKDPDFLIIARTDARACEGFEAAIERAAAYASVGADLIFVEAPQSLAELERIPRLVNAPVMANMVEGAKTPLVSAAELSAQGYCLVIYPNTLLRVCVKAAQTSLATLRAEGTTRGLLDAMITWEERQRLVQLAELEQIERRYSA